MFASNTATTKVCLDCNATLANTARHDCINLATYFLKASLSDTANGVKIQASDDEHASLQAIGIILDKAISNDLWAKGLIELRDREGRLVRTMPAKNIKVIDYTPFDESVINTDAVKALSNDELDTVLAILTKAGY